MKKVLFALVLIATASTASAFELVTGKGTINALVIEGKAYSIPLNHICFTPTFRGYDVGRDGKYVTIDGVISRIVCTGGTGGGGDSTATYRDEWKDSPLVSDDGKVTINPGEVKTEHPSTDPTDSGFEVDGPPSIDG